MSISLTLIIVRLFTFGALRSSWRVVCLIAAGPSNASVCIIVTTYLFSLSL
jgi:hypothetical protein